MGREKVLLAAVVEDEFLSSGKTEYEAFCLRYS